MPADPAWSATPQSYLDKIFQIPFSLRPMDRAGFERLVRRTAGAPDTSQRAGAVEGRPDVPESLPVGDEAAAAAALSDATAGGKRPDAPDDTDGERLISLADVPEASLVTTSTVGSAPSALAFVSAGHRLVLVRDDIESDAQIVSTLDARTGTSIGFWRPDGQVTSVAAGGSLVAVLSAGEARLAEADTGREIEAVTGTFSALTFSADGRWLTAAGPDGLLHVGTMIRRARPTTAALPSDLSHSSCCPKSGARSWSAVARYPWSHCRTLAMA